MNSNCEEIADAVKFWQLCFEMNSLTHHYCSRTSQRRQSLHLVAAEWAARWSHLQIQGYINNTTLLASSRRFTCTEETLPALGVVVEGSAVVGALVVALGSAALDVGHLGDVGVGEGQVVTRLVYILTVGRHWQISSVKNIFVQSISQIGT